MKTRLSVLLWILLGFVCEALAILCYQCNTFPREARTPCPASLATNFGFQFDACVVYQLESGQVVYQHGVVSSSTNAPCTKNITGLESMMSGIFGVKGRVMCCKSNRCNGKIPDYFWSGRDVFIEDFFAKVQDFPKTDRQEQKMPLMGSKGASKEDYYFSAPLLTFLCLAFCTFLTELHSSS